MRWSQIKPFLAGSLAVCLTSQPLMSFGLTVELPSKMVNIVYPEAFQAQIEEVLVCIEEAEKEIYDEATWSSIPKIEHQETRSCREILKTKPFANDLAFRVDYSKRPSASPRMSSSMNGEAPLTILDTPLGLDPSNGYLKETETLEIAMRLFVELNANMTYDILLEHQEEGILDFLYLRMFNMSYELPKVQGHPIFTEFMRDIRDSYFRVSGSFYFRSLLYYAYNNNPDKELDEPLLRFLFHVEEAGSNIDNYVPDENESPYSDMPDLTPSLPNPDDLGWGDLEASWDIVYEDVVKEEDKEDLGDSYEINTPAVSRETLKTYHIKNGVCMRTTVVTENGKEVERKEDKAPSNEIYRCGSTELLGTVPTTNDSEFLALDLNPIVSYRYNQHGKEGDWIHTTIKAGNGALDYEFLVDLLVTVVKEFGMGSLQENERYLYVFEGKLLYLSSYEEAWDVREINEWLASENIPLEFGLNVEKNQNMEEFFEWLATQDSEKTEAKPEENVQSEPKVQ